MNSSPVEAARRQAASGRARDAEARLRAAGDAGSAEALAELAIWYLRGDVLPRDVAAARVLLERARIIGHVDAALMEIALVANGDGGPADWKGAVALLEQAGRSDPVAAQQLTLLGAMSIDDRGDPRTLPKPERLSATPRIERIPAFCTPVEGAYLASIVSNSLERGTVVDPASGKLVVHPIRTSDVAIIGRAQESLVVQAINRRIAAATGTDAKQGEALTVLRYAPGQQYRLHMDALPGSSNQRIITAILYLNQGYAGGETQFPLLDLKIVPRAGDLLIFDNVDAMGAPEPLSRHAGLPVLAGAKWIATRWIRMRPLDPWDLSAAD
jgi:prolyl 4-hydroxylase